MMELLSLPPELVLCIAAQLPARDHLNLSLANRYMSELLIPQLYQLDSKRTNGTRQILHHIRKDSSVEALDRAIQKHSLKATATNDFTDSTALHAAIFYQRGEIAMYLLERGGADVNARDDRGNTPLVRHLASSSRCGAGMLMGSSTLQLVKDTRKG